MSTYEPNSNLTHKKKKKKKKKGKKRKRIDRNDQDVYANHNNSKCTKNKKKQSECKSITVPLTVKYKTRPRGVNKTMDDNDYVNYVNKLEAVHALRNNCAPLWKITAPNYEQKQKQKKDKKRIAENNGRSIPCSKCNKIFNSWTKQKEHLKSHSNDNDLLINDSIPTLFDLSIHDGKPCGDNWSVINPAGNRYELTTTDPFADYADDKWLCNNAGPSNKKLFVPSTAYLNCNPYPFGNNDKIMASNKLIRKYKQTINWNNSNTDEFVLCNYTLINPHDEYPYISNIESFPGELCIQCNQHLSVLRICSVGNGKLKYHNKEFNVIVYRIALLCPNFPYCEFPRARKGWSKNWWRYAYFFNKTTAFKSVKRAKKVTQNRNKIHKKMIIKKKKKKIIDLSDVLSDGFKDDGDNQDGFNSEGSLSSAFEEDDKHKINPPPIKKRKLSLTKQSSPSHSISTVSNSTVSYSNSILSNDRSLQPAPSSSPLAVKLSLGNLPKFDLSLNAQPFGSIPSLPSNIPFSSISSANVPLSLGALPKFDLSVNLPVFNDISAPSDTHSWINGLNGLNDDNIGDDLEADHDWMNNRGHIIIPPDLKELR